MIARHELMIIEMELLMVSKVYETWNLMRIVYVLEMNYVGLPIETVRIMITLYFSQDLCERFNLLQRL